LDINLECIKKTLLNYKGVKRRLEIKFDDHGLLVIDDYAHHPTEINATLQAIRNLKKERVIAVFQPHRYTRTQLLLAEFSASFDSADYVIITDIYAASEPPIEGVSAWHIYDKIKERASHKEVHFLAKDKIVGHIVRVAKPGDVVIMLGAGDIVKVSDELVEELKRQGKF
jgi:UDP-N-acetylmuramate--alanine ligase